MKLFEIPEHNLPVVQYALVQRLKIVQAELVVLRLARTRDLSQVERWQLPANLQKLSRKDLVEQVDPWISLVDTIQGLIDDFVSDNSP